MGADNRLLSDMDIGADDAVGPDFNIVGNFGLR
jgi:hypothetical protein